MILGLADGASSPVLPSLTLFYPPSPTISRNRIAKTATFAAPPVPSSDLASRYSILLRKRARPIATLKRALGNARCILTSFLSAEIPFANVSPQYDRPCFNQGQLQKPATGVKDGGVRV